MSIMKSTRASLTVVAIAAAGYYGYRWITGERSEPWSGLDNDGGLPETRTDAPEAPVGGNEVDEVNAMIDKVLAEAKARFAKREHGKIPDLVQDVILNATAS